MQRPEDRPASPSLLPSYILFATTAAVLLLAFLAPVFSVGGVDVVGSGLSQGAIDRAAGVQGKNIFTIKGATVLANLRRVPEILVTGVDLSLPNSVTVRAIRRRGVLAWVQHGQIYLVDKFGRLIQQVQSSSLPAVVNATGHPVPLGGYANEVAIVAGRYVERSLGWAHINRLTLDRRRGLILQSQQGWKAVMGLPSGRALVTRVSLLRGLLKQTRTSARHLVFVNLRSRPLYASFSP